jgi:hypothetical protein
LRQTRHFEDVEHLGRSVRGPQFWKFRIK